MIMEKDMLEMGSIEGGGPPAEGIQTHAMPSGPARSSPDDGQNASPGNGHGSLSARAVDEILASRRPLDLKRLIDDIEKEILIHVLREAEGNQKEAAAKLGIKYTTLNEKVKRLRIRFKRTVD